MSAVATTITGSTGSQIYEDCSDSGCGGMGLTGGDNIFRRYVSIGCSGTNAIKSAGESAFDDCIVAGQTGGTGGISIVNASTVRNCTITGSSQSGYAGVAINGDGCTVENCIVTSLSGTSAKAFSVGTGYLSNRFVNCATYNNTLDFDTKIPTYQQVGCIVLTADPFVAAGSNNYALNTSAGGGAACRAAGSPTAFQGVSTSNYRDIGAVQASSASGSNQGKKTGPGGGRVGWLDRPGVIPMPVRPSELILTRKAG